MWKDGEKTRKYIAGTKRKTKLRRRMKKKEYK
jgi:hypothetical protein